MRDNLQQDKLYFCNIFGFDLKSVRVFSDINNLSEVEQ